LDLYDFARALAGQEHEADSLARLLRVESPGDQIQLAAFHDCVGLFQKQVERLQLRDAAGRGEKRTARFLPEEGRVGDVVRVSAGVGGAAVPAGVELEHSGTAAAGGLRLRVQRPDWSRVVRGPIDLRAVRV